MSDMWLLVPGGECRYGDNARPGGIAPLLTGRENIYMYGTLLGLSRRQIAQILGPDRGGGDVKRDGVSGDVSKGLAGRDVIRSLADDQGDGDVLGPADARREVDHERE